MNTQETFSLDFSLQALSCSLHPKETAGIFSDILRSNGFFNILSL